jgi:hypothetical protein
LPDYDDALLVPLELDRLTVPMLRLTEDGPPPLADIKVGDQAYAYDRSYPVKGYSAVMPRYVSEQVAAGKKPLVIERPERLYLYWAN